MSTTTTWNLVVPTSDHNAACGMDLAHRQINVYAPEHDGRNAYKGFVVLDAMRRPGISSQWLWRWGLVLEVLGALDGVVVKEDRCEVNSGAVIAARVTLPDGFLFPWGLVRALAATNMPKGGLNWRDTATR